MIIDLHADLLSYLAQHPYNSLYDEESRTSLAQLKKGGVALQILPIYTKTKRGRTFGTGLKQAKIYREVQPFINSRLSIENASSLFGEEEPFANGLRRLDWIVKTIQPPLYMSLTWNGENRFGGGNLTKIGLKEDGKRLLDELEGRVLAIDFSHTSDILAHDIIKYHQKERLRLILLASHSNFRAVHDHLRNLPTALAEVICAAGGLIGLNFIRPFLGQSKESFFKHVEYGLKRGYEDNLALGSDFFASSLLPGKTDYFFIGLDNASCFAYIQKELCSRFGKKIAHKICYANAARVLSLGPIAAGEIGKQAHAGP